jgi:hypothetical protein
VLIEINLAAFERDQPCVAVLGLCGVVKHMFRHWIASALAVLTAVIVAACATSSYGPRGAQSESGYADTRLGDARWRVEYVGASVDSRERVEDSLLRRAAELTTQNGYQWFLPNQPEVTQESEIVVEARRTQAHAVWRPHWRRRSLLRWSDWDPRGPEPAPETPPSTWTASRYSASAEITLGRGPMPQGAFDAAAILASQVGAQR